MAEAQTLKMMKSLDAPHYDGQRTTWSPSSDIVNMFQDTLVAMDWDGKTAIPYLAKSWTISADGKLYTFKLRDDVTFCSGKKFTADDVVYSFKRLTSPELKAPLAWRAGSLKDIRRSVEEMFRVLKPGGVAAIATEYRIEGPPGLPGTVLFDEDQLRSVVLDGMKWELASPLDLSIDEETLLTVVEWRSLMKSGEYPTLPTRLLSALRGQGWDPPEPDVEFVPPPLPHLVIRFDDYIWTSVHLTLIKPS